MVASCLPGSGDTAYNLGVCTGVESNERPFGSQAGTQSTKPRQLGQMMTILKIAFKLLFFNKTEFYSGLLYFDFCLVVIYYARNFLIFCIHCVTKIKHGPCIFLIFILQTKNIVEHERIKLFSEAF